MKRTVKVKVLPAGDISEHSPSGRQVARSVASLVQQFGGYSFSMEAPDGSNVQVSLEHLKERDPEATFVVVSVHVEAESEKEGAELEARLDQSND